MFANPKPRSFLHFLTAGSLALSAVFAWAEPVRIDFVPPPIEGTLSLGIYDSAGKLVRVLHREAENADFTLGDDGLRTQWDGNDDHGIPCPAGTYRAKGVAVGDLGVEGVDFIGNDWVGGDNAPHLSKITNLKVDGTGTLFIAGLLPGQEQPLVYTAAIKPSDTPGEDAEVVLTPATGLPASYPDRPRKPAPARTPPAAQPDDPPIVKLTASPTEDKIFVLYENADLQRLRGYDFTGVKPGGEPKLIFQNDIAFSTSYEQIASRLKFPDGRPFAPAPVLTVTLPANPLAAPAPGDKKKPKPPTLQLRAQVDKEGAWIATADGLPLSKVSDAANLKWAALGRPSANRPVTFFDSDGAAVEEFQVSGITNLMTFDAGTYPWNPNAPLPTPSASPSATATPSDNLPGATLSGTAKP